MPNFRLWEPRELDKAAAHRPDVSRLILREGIGDVGDAAGMSAMVAAGNLIDGDGVDVRRKSEGGEVEAARKTELRGERTAEGELRGREPWSG